MKSLKALKFNLACRITILILLTFLIKSSLFAQNYNEKLDKNYVIKTKYTVLESDSKSFRSFFGGKSGQLSFKLVELVNLSNKEKIFGVEISIEASEIEQEKSSIAFANISNLWGVSASVTYKNIQNSGYIFLNKNDLETIINFLNEIIGATGQTHDKFTMYKISIREQLEIGMIYNNTSIETNKWEFIFTINESTYRLKYLDGIAMLRSLSKYTKFISNNQP